MLPDLFGRRDAPDATVLTVSVEVPLAPFTVPGPRLHFGDAAVAGVTLHVRLTFELKPPEAVTVTVDVAEPPGVTVAGENAVAVSAKPVTVKLAVVV
jgi:hypothetical protein